MMWLLLLELRRLVLYQWRWLFMHSWQSTSSFLIISTVSWSRRIANLLWWVVNSWFLNLNRTIIKNAGFITSYSVGQLFFSALLFGFYCDSVLNWHAFSTFVMRILCWNDDLSNFFSIISAFPPWIYHL